MSRSFIFEGQDVLANLVDKPERLVFLILLHGHREPERRPVPSLDCRGDEAQLEGLQLLVSGSFKDGDVDVKVGDLLVDRALVLFETNRLELCLCIVASVC